MLITVIGDAFIDITVPVEDTNPGETHTRKISLQCGGTANVSRGITQCGGKTAFVGRIGKDLFGQFFKNCLKKSNVRDVSFIDTKYPTGVCISTTHARGERTLLVDRGANDFFCESEFLKKRSLFSQSDVIYISGYSLQSKKNDNVIKKCLDLFHTDSQKDSQKIIFNPGAPNIITTEQIEFIKKYVDILILNFDEARKMTQSESQERIGKQIKKIVDTAIITHGSKGCLLIDHDQLSSIKTPSIHALDTTGAGDAFSSGFIVGLFNGNSLIDACNMGNEFAGKIIVQKNEALQ